MGCRVLVDAVAATSGGGASRLRELAGTLPRYRPDYRILFVAQQAHQRELRASGGALRVLSPSRPFARIPFRLAWEHGMLPVVARRTFDPDVVLAPFNVAPLRWGDPAPGMVVIVSNLAPYSEAVCRLYRGRELLRLRLLRGLTDLTLARAQRILLLSPQAFDLIDDHLLRGKAELLPMAPPAIPTDPPASPPPMDRYLLVAGDLLRYKGIEILIGALGLLPADERPHAIVAGRPVDRPYVRALKRLAHATGVTDGVSFIGAVSHSQLLDLMRQSTACVVTSRFENPSRVPVEAMAAGAPVIASDIPAFRFTCGTAASFFALDRPQQLAACITDVSRDPRVGDDLRRRGRDQLANLHPGTASESIAEAIDAVAVRSRRSNR